MVGRIGIIGYSEGNGHPFSFSAIVNGYDEAGFAQAGLPVIHDYLKRQPNTNFGFEGFRVTRAWTQDPALTARLCAACKIDAAVEDPEAMIDDIDSVIIARDDWESHLMLAKPFLRAGKKVFIDKPLTLDAAELAAFRPYLEQGQLMCTSGLRYACELQAGEDHVAEIGSVRLISATVLNGLVKYGIHMIEAAAGLGLGTPVSFTRLEATHEAYHITLSGGAIMSLNCLGSVGKTFRMSLFGDRGHRHFDLHDNFCAFRRTLGRFLEMVKTGLPPIPAEEVLTIQTGLAAASRLAPGETVRVEAP